MWVKLAFSLISMWLGISIFYTAFITPAAFKTVPEDRVGNFLSVTFPVFYRLGILLFLSSAAMFFFNRLFVPSMLSVMGFIFLVFAEILRIQMRKVRAKILENPEEENLKIDFFNLHRFSAYCNFTSIISALMIVFIQIFG